MAILQRWVLRQDDTAEPETQPIVLNAQGNLEFGTKSFRVCGGTSGKRVRQLLIVFLWEEQTFPAFAMTGKYDPTSESRIILLHHPHHVFCPPSHDEDLGVEGPVCPDGSFLLCGEDHTLIHLRPESSLCLSYSDREPVELAFAIRNAGGTVTFADPYEDEDPTDVPPDESERSEP